MKIKARVGAPKVKARVGPKVKAKVVPSTGWGTPQEHYTRGCMLLLFHKVLYEDHARPCITDAEYDALERHVETLERHPDVTPHPDSPTHKGLLPEVLPRTVQRWLRMYKNTRKPPVMPKEVT